MGNMKTNIIRSLVVSVFSISSLYADIGIISPGEVPAGSSFDVKWKAAEVPDGGSISVTAEDGSKIRGSYAYIAPPPKEQKVTLTAPVVPGTYGLAYRAPRKEATAPVTFAVTAVTATLSAPDTAEIGQEIVVNFEGNANRKDMILLLGPGEEKKRHSYAYPGSSKDGTVKLKAPVVEGTYRIVYSMTGEILAEHPLQVGGTSASLKAPETAAAGSEVEIVWEGPNNKGDNIIIRDQEGKRVSATGYLGNFKDQTVNLRAPMQSGDYTLAYLTSGKVIAEIPLKITGVSAALEAGETAQAGSTVEVVWDEPNNKGDIVTLHDAEGNRVSGNSYIGSRKSNLVLIEVPEKIGDYTLVYVSGGEILGKRPIEVVPVSATLDAAEEVTAGFRFEVEWTGPGNHRDLIVLRPVGETTDRVAYTYLDPDESVATLGAPDEAGEYVLHYLTRAGKSLASRPLKVVPAPEKPGTLVVTSDFAAGFGEGAGIEVILDASGSMLQKQDGKRRIEIARETLVSLVTETIPAGTPFALRVFGHREADSCRTDLEVPLAPLAPSSLVPVIEKINAINLAKTPIADSLAAVSSDLAEVTGERIVILLTDGEETCGGDPALAIRELRTAGTAVRVNIVGYAIEDEGLKQSFESWAALGGGRYLNAPSAKELTEAMKQALAIPYKIFDADKLVASGTSGGKPHMLPPGEYSLRYSRGGEQVEKLATVAEEEVTEVGLP